MCGLAGFVTSLDQSTSEGIVRKMVQELRHRGPDAQTFKTWNLENKKTLAFGHSLLRIFGEEGEGIQPFLIADAALLFNGAIYNFIELKHELITEGVTFKTSTDTEVLAWGLKIHGLEFLKKARGMYALAFFNMTTNELWLARDPLGVKPLYVTGRGEALAFASEYKVLLPFIKSAEVDEQAVNDYLRLRYVPGDQTLIRQIRKVNPGTLIAVHLLTGERSDKKLYDLEQASGSEANILPMLEQAIERRAVASVPVAALLSGGIDSSLVCDFLAHKIPQLKSYTLKVGDGTYDESQKAQAIARRIGIENHVLVAPRENLESLRRLSQHLDDPYGDPIILALDQIFRAIGRTQRVLVTGEGADELFSGYIHHRAVGLLDKVPTFLFGLGQQCLRVIPLSLIRRLLPYAGKVSLVDLSTALRRFRSIDLYDLTSIQRVFFLFDEQDIIGKKTSMLSVKSSKRVGLKELRLWDFKNWLPHSQLFKLDKIAMASSIEAREPFVDQDLLAAVQAVPVARHVQLHMDKPYFRKLVAGQTRIGDDVVLSRKTSFFQPFDQKHLGDLPKEMKILVSGKRQLLERYVQPKALDDLLNSQDEGLLRQKKIFALGMLVLWFEEVFGLAGQGVSIE